MIKAVITDSHSGKGEGEGEREGEDEVAGWACWGFRGFQEQEACPPSIPEPEPEPEPEHRPSDKDKERVEKTKQEVPEPHHLLPEIQQLARLTDRAMSHYSALLAPFPTTKYLILVAIAVLPSYQGLGIGSSLIAYGTSVADERGVFTWVSSSDAGYKAFEKQGFKEIGRLELDLDDFAEDGVRNEMTKDGKWGRYVWRWMKRDVGGGRKG